MASQKLRLPTMPIPRVDAAAPRLSSKREKVLGFNKLFCPSHRHHSMGFLRWSSVRFLVPEHYTPTKKNLQELLNGAFYYVHLYLRYISKSYITRLFWLFLVKKTHPSTPFNLTLSVQAVVLESYLYVLGGCGNANASNKPLTLCSRWVPGIDEAVDVDVAVVDGMSWGIHGWCSFGVTWWNGAEQNVKCEGKAS